MKISLQEHADKQTLEIPAAFRISSAEVYLKQIGNSLVLIPADNPWESLFESLALFSEDFLSERKQPEVQNRNFFS